MSLPAWLRWSLPLCSLRCFVARRGWPYFSAYVRIDAPPPRACEPAKQQLCSGSSYEYMYAAAAAMQRQQRALPPRAAALPLPVLTNILVSYLSPDAHRRRATSSSDKAIKILNHVALGPTLE